MKSGYIKRYLFLIVIIVNCYSGFAQTPTYKLFATNFAQTDSNIIEFDIFLLRTGSTPLQLSYLQIALKFDSAITRMVTTNSPFHSFCIPSIVNGTSELNTAQAPVSAQMNTVKSNGWANDHIFRFISGQPVPPNGSGTFISNVYTNCSRPGTRVARLRIVNQFSSTNTTPVAFKANSLTNGVFISSLGSGPPTGVNAYVIGQSTQQVITDSTQHFSYNVSAPVTIT